MRTAAVESVPEHDAEKLRALSRALFSGASYRAEIGAAIADADAPVCAKDLLRVLDGKVGKATVSNEFKTLQQTGLLRAAPVDPNDRRKFLVPDEESAYWRLCQELRDAARP